MATKAPVAIEEFNRRGYSNQVIISAVRQHDPSWTANMNRFVLIVALCFYASSWGQSQAQWYMGGVGTPFSAEQHGIADIIRSEGVYNALTAQGMVDFEVARGKYIDNARNWMEFRIARKRAIAAERAKDLEEQIASRDRYLEFRQSNPDTPPRLGQNELDTTTGEIKWPLALKRDCFVLLRREMEGLFTSNVKYGSTSENSQSVRLKTREIQAELRRHIKDMSTEEYIQARKFLRSLEFEGRIPAG
jgi:hypothetical protein